MTLGVRDGSYEVRHREGNHSIPPSQVRSIVMQPGTKITHEAVMVALHEETEVLFMDGKGFPIGRVWSPRFGSIATIRKHQVLLSRSKEGLKWVKTTINRKVDNHLAILSMLPEWDYLHQQELEQEQARIEKLREKITAVEGEQIQDVAGHLRNLEGRAGKIYWQAVSRALPDAYRFPKRSQHPAKDMFNAMINYAYGMLYGLVEGALIQAGIDPYLGLFHRDEYNRPSMAFDFIEPYRVWADYVVIRLCMEQLIFIEFFDLQGEEVRLNKQGKQILIPTMNEYLAEVISLGGVSRSRREHIHREARAFAAMLKSPFSPSEEFLSDSPKS